MTTHSLVLRRVILLAALLLPAPLFAAGFTCAQPAESGEKDRQNETEEAAIRISDQTLSGKDMQAWLRLLVGQYTYGGYVDLCGNGNTKDRRPVSGKADCIAVSSTPNVHCIVNAGWPAATRENGAPVLGGVSNLSPAEFLFSIEIPSGPMFKGKGANGWGLVFLQLDNRGRGEWASGVLVGDTFFSRELCFDIPGDCHRTKRITVKPDSNEIFMQVDVAIDHQRVLRQSFLLHRKPDAPPGVQSTGSAP